MTYRFCCPLEVTRKAREEWRRFKEDFLAKYERLRLFSEPFAVQSLDIMGDVVATYKDFSEYSSADEALDDLPIGPALCWALRLI